MFDQSLQHCPSEVVLGQGISMGVQLAAGGGERVKWLAVPHRLSAPPAAGKASPAGSAAIPRVAPSCFYPFSWCHGLADPKLALLKRLGAPIPIHVFHANSSWHGTHARSVHGQDALPGGNAGQLSVIAADFSQANPALRPRESTQRPRAPRPPPGRAICAGCTRQRLGGA